MRMQFRVVRLSGWRAVVAVVAGLAALAAVIALMVVGFFVVVLPAVAVAAIAWLFLPKAKRRSMGSAGDSGTIEGTYEIVPEIVPENAETKRLERQGPP